MENSPLFSSKNGLDLGKSLSNDHKGFTCVTRIAIPKQSGYMTFHLAMELSLPIRIVK